MIRAPVSGLIHGTSVAFPTGSEQAGVLITGKPGAGKSELALELMAMGAALVADDQTRLERRDTHIRLSCPAQLHGLIEMRGIGLLRAEPVASARLVLMVDLDTPENARMPEPRWHEIDGTRIPLLRKCASRAFAAAIRQYVLMGICRETGAPPA